MDLVSSSLWDLPFLQYLGNVSKLIWREDKLYLYQQSYLIFHLFILTILNNMYYYTHFTDENSKAGYLECNLPVMFYLANYMISIQIQIF